MEILDYLTLYAPSVLCLLSSFIALLKVGKLLKTNVKDITGSKEIKGLKKEMKNLKDQLACSERYQIQIIELIKEKEKNEIPNDEDLQKKANNNELD